MDSAEFSDIDNQVELIEKSLKIAKCIKEKYVKILNEKQAAIQKCAELEDKLAKIKSEKCIECSVLRNKLIIERREKEQIKKGEKATLLKKIAEMVASLDEKNYQMTNAQFLTQLVCEGLNDSPPSKEKREITLIDEKKQEESSLVLVNETIVADSEESSNECDSKPRVPIIIPETEQTNLFHINTKTSERRHKHDISLKKIRHNFKESGLTSSTIVNHNNEEYKSDQKAKKLKLSSSSEHLKDNWSENGASNLTNNYVKFDADPTPEAVEDSSSSSPSVFSQTAIENHNTQVSGRGNSDDLKNIGLTRDSKVNEDKPAALWKLKPSLTVSGGNAVNGKKLKQTVLSLARPEKKNDISLNQGFKGGISNINQKLKAQKDDEQDYILPSPDRTTKNSFVHMRKESFETVEDPDLTVFHPVVTSTCLPVAHNSSFDRLPERATSPSYKYRRETVRKRDERMKLPGQQCVDCAKYYEAAGLDKTQEVRERMNKCSRHRDKYDVKIHTPPGFWDPVIPITPEGSQE